jgi:hypothetical protein
LKKKADMDEVKVRPAAVADGAAIAAVHTESWRSAYRGILSDQYLDDEIAADRLRHWEERLRAPGAGRRRLLLAEQRQELLGFACVLRDAEPGWGACLDNLHVRPHVRGRGLGRRLFAEAARWVAEKQPGAPLYLWVFETNRPARGFYESCGGVVAGSEMRPLPGGPQVDSLRYVWPDVAGLHRRLADRTE